MKRIVKLKPVVSLTQWIGVDEIVGFNVGPDGCVYLILAQKVLDVRHVTTRGSFAKSVPNQPNRYHVVGLCGAKEQLNVIIENERFNIHDIQPLGDELLLVCGRSAYRGPADFERNGRVYTRDGKFTREILLGDGIQDVQTTPSGVIWTSFFDEGIFGNNGWNNPVGSSGLVAWDASGTKLYEFQPTAGLDSICDCYALNVASEEDIWQYYYTEFPLVWLKGRVVRKFWNAPVRGSDAFAITGTHVLFRGGYDERTSLELFSLDYGGSMKHVARLELQDENGSVLTPERVVGRGSALHFMSGNNLYCLNVDDAF